jgi:hypothetical protein
MSFELKVVFTGLFMYARDSGDPEAQDRRERLHVLAPDTRAHAYGEPHAHIQGGVVGHSFEPSPGGAAALEAAASTDGSTKMAATGNALVTSLARLMGAQGPGASPAGETAMEPGSEPASAAGLAGEAEAEGTGEPEAEGHTHVEEHVARIHVNEAFLHPGSTEGEDSLHEVVLNDCVLELEGLGQGIDLTLDEGKLVDVGKLLGGSVDRALVGPSPRPAGMVAARVSMDAGRITGFGPCAVFFLEGRQPSEEGEMAFRVEWTIPVASPETDGEGNEMLQLRLKRLDGSDAGTLPPLYPMPIPPRAGDADRSIRPQVILHVSHIPVNEFAHATPKLESTAHHFTALYPLCGGDGPAPVLRALPQGIEGPIGSAPQGCTGGSAVVKP